jgi:ribosomal protein L11 methylase PrmA
MQRVSGSFRDPSGQVFQEGGRIVRTINECYSEHWSYLLDSGLLNEMLQQRLLPSFSECTARNGAWKCLEVQFIPFISYPYEWCFSQLKDAALLTLKLQLAALEKGVTLKDASAYNVQFVGSRPIFIDLLSFEIWREGTPWQAYRQFCMHFLAPLVLCNRFGHWPLTLSRLWIDGIPLSHACSMLPWYSCLRSSVALHIFAHAQMEKRHADARKSAAIARKVSLSQKTMSNLALSLQSATEAQTLPILSTQWGDYYDDTNYSSAAAASKLKTVKSVAEEHKGGRLAVDIGANTGRYSLAMAPLFEQVLAIDVDPLAVERHYLQLKKEGPGNILPLVIDLSNLSPSLGWACSERDSFISRCRADFITALAVIHHLVIASGIPFQHVSDFLASLLVADGSLLIEFVPKEDSQVQRMLAARDDIFEEYSLEGLLKVFSQQFAQHALYQLPDSQRVLIHFKKIDVASN